jgi:multidrug efflux pump subunit AcrB
VRTIATVQSAEELGALEIPLSDGRRIRLDQVATVTDTVAEQRSAALLNGKPVVGFEIVRARGAGEIDVAAGVRAALEQLKAEHPDITITEAFNFVDPVVENYDGSMLLLYEGAALAVLVVFLFLRDWRATLVAAVALPLSVIPTFAVMHLMGFTINIVTLLSLSLVVGILVDDAIVEIENIMRHLRMGKTPYQAAMEAADEIGLAVIATTFTLIAVFLPTAFMSGVAGQVLRAVRLDGGDRGVLLAGGGAHAHADDGGLPAESRPRHEQHEPRLDAHLPALGAWCLKHRVRHAAGAGVFFVGSWGWTPLLPTGFIPPDDLSQTQVTLTLPPGSTFADARAGRAGAALVQANPHVKLVYTAIGGGSAGGDPFAPQGRPEVRKATLTINMTPREPSARREQAAIEGSCARRWRSCRARGSRSGWAAPARSTCWCWPARTGACWPTTRCRSSASCAPSPASATSPPPPAWCGPSWWCGPTSRAPPTWASPPPRSPTPCASPPPATTTRRWPS